jgi:drug/metabolite transporter (DMT)-like permease
MTRPGPFAGLLLAVLCVSLGSILIRKAEAPALATSFHRVFLASLVVAPFTAGPAWRAFSALRPRDRWLIAASGLALALHFATWIASLAWTSVAASVLLVNTAPLFTLGLARFFLGEAPSASTLQAMVLALAGAALIAVGDWGPSRAALWGDLLALLGAATLSAYHVIGRGLREALPLGAYVLGVWATAAAVLGVLAAVGGVPLAGYSPRTFGWLLGLALVPTVAGHGLVNRSLRVLPAPTVGLFLLGEPVGASVLAYLAFGEVPGAWTLAGGALVLAALVLVVRGGGR